MGNGVPNEEHHVIFEPTTGDLISRIVFASHGDHTRVEFNAIRADAVTAGGMSNVTAAYAAIKSAWNTLESGRGAWLDHKTTGMNSTETDLARAGVVWLFVGRGEIPSPPQP